MATHADGFVTLPGQAPVWNMDTGRAAMFNLLSEQTGNRVVVFEEVMSAGCETPLHLQSLDPATVERLRHQYGWEIVGPPPF